MISNEEKTKKKGPFDYPESSEDTNKKADFWDQVETSTDFNLGITGNKLVSAAHIESRKPGETDWFKVYGSSKKDLTKGLIVKLKVDVIDQDFIVIGPVDFKAQILDGFKKGKLVYLAYYETSSGRLGVWPVAIPTPDKNGNINSYNQTAFQIMERAQHEWVNMKTNQGDKVYDGWTAKKEDQEMFGTPGFRVDYKEVCKKAFNDRVIKPDNYKINPYVMRVLDASQIKAEVKI